MNEETKKPVFPTWPQYAQDEIDAVSAVLRSGNANAWTGDQVRTFAQEFAEYIGAPYGIAVCNGTVALELALYALGISPDDDVIVPCKSFVATASSVVVYGARPVFADVDPESQNITVKNIKKVMTPKTRAIIVVHLGGWPCAMDTVCEFAAQNNLQVIEDCAQAHGATYKGKRVGSFGDAAAFSFCQDKIMTTGGEGGMLLLRDKKAWQRAWAYKDHGKDYDAVSQPCKDAGFQWVHHTFGTNWRMTEVQAAIGRKQLKKLPKWLSTRRRNAGILHDGLKDIQGLRLSGPPDYIEHAYYRYYVFVETNKLRKGWNKGRIIEALMARGIPCFEGSCSEIYREKSFSDAGLAPASRLPTGKILSETSLCFLVHPTLTEKDMEIMCNVICEVMAGATSLTDSRQGLKV